MTPEDFEAGVAQDILQKKLRHFLMTFSPVTEQEVLDHYTFLNRKVKISFVQFLPKDFEESVEHDPESMEDYFDEDKEEYRVPEKIKIAYIAIDPNKSEDEIVITDQQVKDYYEDNEEMFRQEKQVKARHILFKLKQDALKEEEEVVREKALLVLGKARGSEDFASLAKEYSEGPTGKRGGDLGFFSSGQMVKPFVEAAFKMKKGEISDLVRTRFGYHIIKVEDIKEAGTRSLEEVRRQIENTLVTMARMDLAHEKALSLIDQMPYEVDLSQYAERHQVPIKQSGYFSSNETIPDIGGDEKLRKSIFSLAKNDVSELMEFKGRFYIIQVVDKKASYLPELKDVKPKVKKNFTSHLATLETRSAAEKYLAELKGGKSWEGLAKEHNLSPNKTDFFTRNDFISQIGYAPDLQEAAFSLGEGRRYPDRVFKNEKGVFVIRWEGLKGIDTEEYKKEKEKYRISLVQAKHQAIFGDWLEDLKKRAEIEIVHPVSGE